MEIVRQYILALVLEGITRVPDPDHWFLGLAGVEDELWRQLWL